MKKIPLLALFVFFTYLANSQQLYDYYYGYVEGFRKGCGCSNQVQKSNELLNNPGTRSDGYNAGYVDGRIFLQNNTQQSNDQPLYNPNTQLMYEVLAAKQQLLNERRQYLQSELDHIGSIINTVQADRVLTDAEKKYYNDFLNLLNKYAQYDLTVNSTYNQIVTWMQQQKAYFLTW